MNLNKLVSTVIVCSHTLTEKHYPRLKWTQKNDAIPEVVRYVEKRNNPLLLQIFPVFLTSSVLVLYTLGDLERTQGCFFWQTASFPLFRKVFLSALLFRCCLNKAF